MSALLPDGYTCQCGKWNSFSAWVYAHWYGKVIHTCECGRKNILSEGEIVDAIQNSPT